MLVPPWSWFPRSAQGKALLRETDGRRGAPLYDRLRYDAVFYTYVCETAGTRGLGPAVLRWGELRYQSMYFHAV